jgi:hypothetical protein
MFGPTSLVFAFALFAAPAERPLPWLGFGAEGGLIVTDQVLSDVNYAKIPEDSSLDEVEAASMRKWLGPKTDIVAVDARADASFFVEVADTGKHPAIGRRFEVIGADGVTCRVEVTRAVRATLGFTDQLRSDDVPRTVVYRGPGERYASSDPAAPDATVITPDEIVNAYPYATPRMIGLVARPVEGTCPFDGIAAAPGALVPAATQVVDPPDAVRALFRKNRSIAALERDYRETLARVGAKHFGCSADAPQHIDMFNSAFRTTLVTVPGQAPLMIAASGGDHVFCDPAAAAVVYRESAKGWAEARELWGAETRPLLLEIYAYEPRTKRTWTMGQTARGRGWQWTLTALDKSGLGRTYGGWPDYDAHMCNYDQTPWEFADICHNPDE